MPKRSFIATLIHAFFPFLSLLYGWLNPVLNYIIMKSELWLETDPETHAARVSQVQGQVQQWIRQGGGKSGQKMSTARPGWKSIALTKTDKSKYFQVSVNFNQIVKLDERKKMVTVEPGVMTGQLSRYLAKRGWTIPMVPEIETLSIGGLVCGVGIETSGHKLGLFHDTVHSLEVVLPTGEAITCSKEDDPDLFYSMAGSFGTIGFLTGITIPLIPAKRYVKVEYRSVSSLKEFHALMKSEPNHDFVEGLAFSKDKMVLMFGDFDNGHNSKIRVHHINRWYKIPYHRQVEAILNSELHSRSSTYAEYIPLVDYYHRHSRAMFWVHENISPIMYSPPVLLFLGWMLPKNLHLQGLIPRRIYNYFAGGQVIQDYVVPMEKAQEFYNAADKLVKIYPIWMCPVKIKKTGSMFVPWVGGQGDYIDLGYYAYPDTKGAGFVKTLRDLEQLCIECKGFQGLYADCFMSKEEFLEMCDTSVYDKVRVKYGCESAFPHVYEKTGPKARNLKLNN